MTPTQPAEGTPLPAREPVADYLKRRSLPDQLRYLAMRLTKGAPSVAVALALNVMAEEQDSAIARVEALAQEWAGLAPPGDWGASVERTVMADAGRAVLAALKGETERQP